MTDVTYESIRREIFPTGRINGRALLALVGASLLLLLAVFHSGAVASFTPEIAGFLAFVGGCAIVLGVALRRPARSWRATTMIVLTMYFWALNSFSLGVEDLPAAAMIGLLVACGWVFDQNWKLLLTSFIGATSTIALIGSMSDPELARMAEAVPQYFA